MAYVITKPCIGTKDRSCVEVCPVDCFYNIKKKKYNRLYKKGPKEAPEDWESKASDDDSNDHGLDWGMLMIHPDECINCGACETECPVEAIYEDAGVPEDSKDFIKFAEDETSAMSDAELDASRCTSKG